MSDHLPDLKTSNAFLRRALRYILALKKEDLPDAPNSPDELDLVHIKEVLSPANLYFALAITDDGFYPKLIDKMDEVDRKGLEEARAHIIEAFGHLFVRPEIRNILIDALPFGADDEAEEGVNIRLAFKSIAAVIGISAWDLRADHVSPLIRFCFYDDDQSLLLDTTIDWEDVAVITDTLLSELSNEVNIIDDLGEKLRSRLNLPTEYLEHVLLHLRSTKTNLDEIEERITRLLRERATGKSEI